MKVDEATDYVPVMERNHNPTAHDEMLRLLEVCTTLTAEVRRLESEAEEFCAKEKKWFADLRQVRNQLAASQHYAERLREALEYLREHKLWANSHAKAIIDSALAKVGAGGTAVQGDMLLPANANAALRGGEAVPLESTVMPSLGEKGGDKHA